MRIQRGPPRWLETLLNEWLSSQGLFPAEREALSARLAALYRD
jgi:hypothetical protein